VRRVTRGIDVLPYDPRWRDEFDAEARRLDAALGQLALEIAHNGSTAVPGLGAKPIIDIQISVATLEPLAMYRERLESAGYVHMPHADDAFCPFFHRPAAWPHTHHVHLVVSGGPEERRTLAFRDYLRDHPETAREYERLKHDLSVQYAGEDAASREAYSAGKSAFVERIVALALNSGYPR
jgi:GrpB-like predicted nucleotidyltransferase (UPF0157 family)